MNENQDTAQPYNEQLADGLEQVARMLRDHPSIAPAFRHALNGISAQVAYLDNDQAAALATLTKAAMRSGAAIEKHADGNYMEVHARFGAVTIEFWADREKVCEARVVGTRKVMKPDPVALAKVPQITVEEPVIEWDCKPLLAAEKAAS